MSDEFYMQLALKKAWEYQGLTYPNPAVGCTIVGNNGEVLAVEAHQKAGEPHAEINALKSAYFKITDDWVHYWWEKDECAKTDKSISDNITRILQYIGEEPLREDSHRGRGSHRRS